MSTRNHRWTVRQTSVARSSAANGSDNVAPQKIQVANETIDDLLRAVTGLSELVESIATASQEQRAGIYQTNNAGSLMDRMTQQNSALVQDVVAAANGPEIQSQQLRGPTVRPVHRQKAKLASQTPKSQRKLVYLAAELRFSHR
jgi:methyl-accepting chemotaxis protein